MKHLWGGGLVLDWLDPRNFVRRTYVYIEMTSTYMYVNSIEKKSTVETG